MELTRDLPQEIRLVTRRYPVDFATVGERLAADLEANYDYAIAPGPGAGLGRDCDWRRSGSMSAPETAKPRTRWSTMGRWLIAARCPRRLGGEARRRRNSGRGFVSRRHIFVQRDAVLELPPGRADELPTQSAFLHLPLDITQTAGTPADQPSLPAAMSAAGVRIILDELAAGGLEA